MKKRSLICKISNRLSLCLWGTVASVFLFSSCSDGFDSDEMFSSDVTGVQLTSPQEADIVITPNAAGDMQTISWKTVMGAGGYRVIVTRLADEPEVLCDSVTDRSQLSVKRAEDENYTVSILTLGNDRYNNQEAEAPTVKSFNTFTPAVAVIPNGADLKEWFEANPVPDDVEGDAAYDLEMGGNYTMSGNIDFGSHNVVLRTASKTDLAKIELTGNASFMTYSGLTLKYLKVDAAKSETPFILMSPNPDDALKTGPKDHYIVNSPIVINSCELNNICGSLISNNGKKYCLSTFMVTNTIVRMTTVTSAVKDQSFITMYNSGGVIAALYLANSTFYNVGDGDCRYFIRYNNNERGPQAGFAETILSSVNCTYYNIGHNADAQWTNYSGVRRQNTTVPIWKNNIFYNCGHGEIMRRVLDGGYSLYSDKADIGNNTYWYDGAPESGNETYDPAHQLQTDPAFADPANGNFTPSGAEQLEYRTGDPRWLP